MNVCVYIYIHIFICLTQLLNTVHVNWTQLWIICSVTFSLHCSCFISKSMFFEGAGVTSLLPAVWDRCSLNFNFPCKSSFSCCHLARLEVNTCFTNRRNNHYCILKILLLDRIRCSVVCNSRRMKQNMVSIIILHCCRLKSLVHAKMKSGRREK